MTSLLIRNARPVRLTATGTATAGTDRPLDVLVRDGLVTEIGPGLARPAGVAEHDAGGRWMMPGLWDSHVHLGQWSAAANRLDTSALDSPDEAVALVAARVADLPGRPVIGWGHRPGTWSRQGTVTELDAVSGVTPVVLVAGDGHHAWLNRAALAALELPLRDDVVREEVKMSLDGVT